jgi:hypothetical protein
MSLRSSSLAPRLGRPGRFAALAVITASVLAGCAPAEPEPIDGPTEAAASDGPFSLVATLPRLDWTAGEPIEIDVAIAYAGAGQATVAGSGGGLAALGVRSPDGRIDTGVAMQSDCARYHLAPGPNPVEAGKSGGWDGNDPNAAWYEAFFARPGLFLPAGDWVLVVEATFAEEDCGGVQRSMAVELRVRVS